MHSRSILKLLGLLLVVAILVTIAAVWPPYPETIIQTVEVKR
jgi:hypothetical protein